MNTTTSIKSRKKVSVNKVLGNITPFNNIPMVSSLDEVAPYQVVRTMNHSLIKPNPKNRNDPKRVKHFVKLIKEGKFYEKTTIILVDYITLMQNDSHHKLEAMRMCDKPVTFMLCDLGEEFRGDFSMESIAKLNNSNSAWTAKDKFDQAYKAGYPVASIINAYKTRLNIAEPTNKFNAWNILNFALGKNCESGVAIEDYRTNSIVKILTKKRFEKEFKALVSIIGKLSMLELAVRPSDVLKRLSVLNGKNEIDIIEFARKFDLFYKTFKPASKNNAYMDLAIKTILRKREI